MATLSREDVDSLAFGNAPTRAAINIFYTHLLSKLLHTEHADHVLEECFIFPYNFFASNGTSIGVAYAPGVGPTAAPPSYLLFPTGGSIMLVCIPGKVFLHMDSERGVIIESKSCCLRGTNGLLLSTRIKRYLKYQYNNCIDIDDWPLKNIKVPLLRQPETASLFSCTVALYLLSNLPPLLTAEAADVLRCYRNTEVDLFHMTPYQYPGFMTRQWFSPETAEALRLELIDVVRQMVPNEGAVHIITYKKTAYPSFPLPLSRIGRQTTKRKQRLSKMSATQRHVTRWADLGAALGVRGSKMVVLERLQVLRQSLTSYANAATCIGYDEPAEAAPQVQKPPPPQVQQQPPPPQVEHQPPPTQVQQPPPAQLQQPPPAQVQQQPPPPQVQQQPPPAQVQQVQQPPPTQVQQVQQPPPTQVQQPPPAQVQHGPPAAPDPASRRVYNTWMSNGRGGCIKQLTPSDLLKLRLKAKARIVDLSDTRIQIMYQDSEASITWNIGLWRPKDAQNFVSFQAGWPALVSQLQLQAGQVVEFQPHGQVEVDGSFIPMILLSIK